jgi:2-oxoglutarate ferredoxin oxidoreductase subunit alpha
MTEKIFNKLSWKVAGEAGHGILNAGLQMFAKSCLRGGLHIFATAEYPSLIRGGHNHLDVRVGDSQIFSHAKGLTILVALDKNSIDKHVEKLVPNGCVIYDSNMIKIDKSYIERNDILVYPVPLLDIAGEAGNKILRNTVAMGATFALTDFDMELLNGVLKTTFSKKGDEVVNMNIKAAKLGYDYVKKNFDTDKFQFKLKKIEQKGKRLFMSGNEAATAGAISGGCKFLAAYPMTPATSIMTNMASQERNFNVVVKHTEDEIAAINMAIGAGHAGARAMTCTSGGGFALMTEGLGLAAQTETPVVIAIAQRPGPGTGMATHSGQGDLKFVLNASTDEFPRIVMAPGTVEDCFFMMADAFNIAEKYQMPVIFLTDKYLGESYCSVPYFDFKKIKTDRGLMLTDEQAEKQDDYKRYKITENGISPRAVPGQKNCMFTASSYEHDEHGFEREEEENRVAMHNKRFRKMEEASKEIDGICMHGDHDAKVALIGWGSTKGPILEAMKMLKNNGVKMKYCQVKFISPLPKEKIDEIISSSDIVIDIENNKTALLSGVIREAIGKDISHKILRYDGRSFAPEDIAEGVEKILHDKSITRIEISKPGIINTEKVKK